VYLCGLTDARRTPVEPTLISTKQFVAHAAYDSACLSVSLTTQMIMRSVTVVCWGKIARKKLWTDSGEIFGINSANWNKSNKTLGTPVTGRAAGEQGANVGPPLCALVQFDLKRPNMARHAVKEIRKCLQGSIGPAHLGPPCWEYFIVVEDMRFDECPLMR